MLDDPLVLQMPTTHSFCIQPVAKYLRQHVILSGPSTVKGPSGKVHAMSAAKWLMLLNNMSPDEASSCVGHSTTLKYSTSCLPSVQWANTCPEKRSIAHMMIPSGRLEELQDDVHDMDDVCMFVITPESYTHLYVVSHWPSRRPQDARQAVVKFQADGIIDSLKGCPSLENQLGPMIEYTKWDVLVYLNNIDQAEPIAEKIRNWDNLVLRSLHQQQLVRTARNKYLQHPPRLWLQFPVALDPHYLLKEISAYICITESEPGTEMGTWVVTLATVETASIMAGCAIPCGSCGTAMMTTGSPEADADLNRGMKVAISSPFLDRTMKISELGNRQLPRLNRQNLDAMQSGN